MQDKTNRGAPGTGGRLPESPTHSEIRWNLAARAVQHPLTLVSAGTFALAGIYYLVLSPVFGAGPVALAALGSSGAVAVASFTVRFRREHADTVRALRDRQGRELRSLRESGIRTRIELLRAGFRDAGVADGIAALESLVEEHDRLRPALDRQDETDPLALPRVTALAEGTYAQGLNVLADALVICREIDVPGNDRLEDQISGLQEEVAGLQADDTQSERLAIKQDVLLALQEQLATRERLRVHADQLFYQAVRCQSSLNNTRLELAAIRAGSSATSLDSMIEALEGTIKRAKEVQLELKSLGF